MWCLAAEEAASILRRDKCMKSVHVYVVHTTANKKAGKPTPVKKKHGSATGTHAASTLLRVHKQTVTMQLL